MTSPERPIDTSFRKIEEELSKLIEILNKEMAFAQSVNWSLLYPEITDLKELQSLFGEKTDEIDQLIEKVNVLHKSIVALVERQY